MKIRFAKIYRRVIQVDTLRLMMNRQGHKVPTTGGMLLFGNESDRFHPNAPSAGNGRSPREIAELNGLTVRATCCRLLRLVTGDRRENRDGHRGSKTAVFQRGIGSVGIMFIEPGKKLIERVRKQPVGLPVPVTDGLDTRSVMGGLVNFR